MAIWWEIFSYRNLIREVEVVEETAKSVVVLESWMGHAPKRNRHLKAQSFFPTRLDALTFLIDKYSRAADQQQNALNETKARLHRLRGGMSE